MLLKIRANGVHGIPAIRTVLANLLQHIG